MILNLVKKNFISTLVFLLFIINISLLIYNFKISKKLFNKIKSIFLIIFIKFHHKLKKYNSKIEIIKFNIKKILFNFLFL